MRLLTSEKIKQGYLRNNLKAKNVISYLITQGFSTEKETEKTALSELNFNGQKIKNVSINSEYIIINFKK